MTGFCYRWPPMWSWLTFSTYFIEFLLHSGCYAKSFRTKSYLEKWYYWIRSPELFNYHYILSKWGFVNLRTREFKVNKKRRKSKMKARIGKCDKRRPHNNYQLPVMFSIFSLILLCKIFLRKDLSRYNWHDIS